MLAHKIIQVHYGNVTAGIVFARGWCTRAAPILKWAIGKSDREVIAYCKRRGWKYIVIDCTEDV